MTNLPISVKIRMDVAQFCSDVMAFAAELSQHEKDRDKALSPVIATAVSGISSYFRNVDKSFLSAIKDDWQAAYRDERAINQADWQQAIGDSLAANRNDLSLQLAMTNTAVAMGMGAFVSETAGSDGIEIDFNNERVTGYLGSVVPDRVAQLDRTTGQQMDNIALESAVAGVSYTELSKRIRANTAKTDKNGNTRSDRISTYESLIRYETGAFLMALITRDNGRQIGKTWHDAGDRRVRATHSDNTGLGVVGLDFVFNGGVLVPPTDANCRCWLTYEIS